MKSGKFELKVRHPRTWLTVLGVVAACFVLWMVWQTFFVQSTNPHSHSPAAPSVAPQKLHPSSFQRTRRLYGPWQLVASGSTGAPHLVMLNANGGVEVSSTTITARSSWQPASAIEIDAVVAGHQTVRLHTTDSNVFTVQYRQAFILAQRPEAVYAFLRNGPGKARLVSKTVAALTKR